MRELASGLESADGVGNPGARVVAVDSDTGKSLEGAYVQHDLARHGNRDLGGQKLNVDPGVIKDGE